MQTPHEDHHCDFLLDDELLNPDEFEEIAEIYDQIRLLHLKLNPLSDATLAADFDTKLREVMEALALAVNTETLAKPTKRERCISAKMDLLTMCSEKICDYLHQQQQGMHGVFLGIVDGMRDSYEDLQLSHLDLVSHLEACKRENQQQKEETN